MDHGDHGGGSGEGGMDMGHSMSMSFHFGVTETILFEFWKTNDIGSLIGSVVLVFFLAVAYEGLKFLREFIQARHRRNSPPYKSFSTVTEEGSNSTPEVIVPSPSEPTIRIFSTIHFAQTGLHFVQFVLSYLLMLIFMTYNVWLCLGVSFGATLGYFIFGWRRLSVQDNNEHCQ